MHLYEETKIKIFKAHHVRGIYPTNYRVLYKNIAELLEYRTHAHADEIFITFYPDGSEKVSLTYKEFAGKVYQTANLLLQNGIGIEERIAAVSHNHINTVIQYFAAWCIGATVVPINVNEEPDRIKYILENSHTKLAFVKDEYYEKNSVILNDLKIKVILHGLNGNKADGNLIVYENEIESYKPEFKTDDNIGRETEALIVYTSGTTGLPKGVVLTQYNLMIDADGISKWHKIEHGQTMMCVLPIHHVNGTIVTLMTPMLCGAKVVLNQKFHTNYFFKRIADENVQIVSVVPTLLQFLCHDYETINENNEDCSLLLLGEGQGVRLPNFRHIICGAGPLTCELASKFEEMFGLRIVHGYGLSETTCYSCFIPVDLDKTDHKKWQSEFGFPAIGIEIEPNEMDIQSDKGESLPDGERGEIVIRGHNVMKYYNSNPDANEKTFEFGWFRSGDEGFYKSDENGRKYFFITGRLKELIIRGGVNIAPLEIDEVIMSIPEVKAGISVGFDNDWYGEEVGALIHLKDNITASEELKNKIIKKCRKQLSFYKTPKAIVFSDTIPVTSTGKYQRNKVKHLFAEFKTIQFKDIK